MARLGPEMTDFEAYEYFCAHAEGPVSRPEFLKAWHSEQKNFVDDLTMRFMCEWYDQAFDGQYPLDGTLAPSAIAARYKPARAWVALLALEHRGQRTSGAA